MQVEGLILVLLVMVGVLHFLGPLSMILLIEDPMFVISLVTWLDISYTHDIFSREGWITLYFPAPMPSVRGCTLGSRGKSRRIKSKAQVTYGGGKEISSPSSRRGFSRWWW